MDIALHSPIEILTARTFSLFVFDPALHYLPLFVEGQRLLAVPVQQWCQPCLEKFPIRHPLHLKQQVLYFPQDRFGNKIEHRSHYHRKSQIQFEWIDPPIEQIRSWSRSNPTVTDYDRQGRSERQSPGVQAAQGAVGPLRAREPGGAVMPWWGGGGLTGILILPSQPVQIRLLCCVLFRNLHI